MEQRTFTMVATPLVRKFLVAIGFICTGLGIIGIFVPLLPTTPFLLLAAACFSRSSKLFHTWLLTHKRLGPMVSGYLDGAGIPARAKMISIAMIWLSLPPSALLLVPVAWVQALLLVLAIAITIHLLRLPTRKVRI